jgi:2-polyprenyl-6-methoxyphenol hydroxylase-like FAD-dependent oxidoreductase
MDRASFDVAVVGYGPGGQALAALLAQQGHQVVAFERYSALYSLPRAGHIDHEAVRLAQRLGDAEAMVATMWEVSDPYVWLNGEGALLMEQPALDPEPSLSGWFSDYTMWQPHLENVLHGGAVTHGADIRFGREVVGLRPDADGVELVVNEVRMAPDGSRVRTEHYERVRARYVIGADGANSFIRTTMGIEREDLGFTERWLDVDLEIIEPVTFAYNIAQICDPARPRMLMPLGRSHRRFEWQLLEDESIADMERPEAAWALLEEFGVTPDNHRIARQIVYTFEARVARAWRDGRVFLIGDAAHTMPPFAGQGALSALRDATNLAWKLDLTLRGLAAEALLDTYETERRPHVHDWTTISLHEGEISCTRDPVAAAERDALLLSGAPLPLPEFPRLGGAIIGGSEPPAGDLSLQARVRKDGASGLFDDVTGAKGFVVLAWNADPADHLDAEASDFLASIGAFVGGVYADEASAPAAALVDADGKYAAYFAQHGIAAFISRPDFYVFETVSDLSQLGEIVDELREDLGAASSGRSDETDAVSAR